jgi:transposase
MLDARQEGDSYRRIEVITGRRRRTAQEKVRIVAESFEEGANRGLLGHVKATRSDRRD